MSANKIWINHPWVRLFQHVCFWAFSFYVFLHIFKIGNRVERIDYIYTLLFHITLLPVIYINLTLLMPKLRQANNWKYILLIVFLIFFFSWMNYSFFDNWSNLILPDYYFISYFSFGEIVLFFITYLTITSLLKLSKSWFLVNKLEKELLIAEKEKAQLELKALQAQMNPHFIFNCMNSIKSLIQQKEEQKAIDYLTSFSRLLRTILQNSDKREITLHDELETCRIYTQLESMRFGNKLKNSFTVENDIDLKSITVPALILQPFIENAIWHGVMPKEEGGKVSVRVVKDGDNICCIIDDDGIGREISKKLKFREGAAAYQSSGVRLTQARFELDNALKRRNASIETIDKTGCDGKASGTSIILTFKKD